MKKLYMICATAFALMAFADDAVEPIIEEQAHTEAATLTTDCTWGDVPLDTCVHDVIDVACPQLAEGLANAENSIAVANRVLAYITGNTNVWFSVTNYYGQVGIPASLQLYEIRDGQTKCVWDQREWTDYEIGKKLESVNDAIDDARDNNPARRWSKYQSVSGEENPLTDTTWISTPRVSLAGGYEWEKVVTTSGSAWVLVNNGLVHNYGQTAKDTVGSAYFRIEDLEGNAIFEIKKTDAYLVGAIAGGVEVDGITLVVHYATIAESHPVSQICLDIGNAVWYDENDPDCPATVVWSGTSGNYTARITPKVASSTIFAMAEYEVPGETLIEHAAPMSATGGIMCTDGIHKCRPVYNSNGTITWEAF